MRKDRYHYIQDIKHHYMNSFVQQLINTITGKEALQFSTVLTIVIIYLVLLWIAFCLWVLIDSYKRYKNILVAVGITLIVFVLNFPALILYLILRPEEDFYMSPTTNQAQGGVEVPVIRFVDNEGNIKLALNLQVSSAWTPDADMTISVGFDSERKDIQVSEPRRIEAPERVQVVREEVRDTPSFRDKVSAFTQRARGATKPAQKVESVKTVDSETEQPERKFTDMQGNQSKKNRK